MDVRICADGDMVRLSLCGKVHSYKMMAGTNGQWIVYYIVKLLLFVVIGVFTAPFTCLWAVFRVIKAFR